jgi:MFS family permease
MCFQKSLLGLAWRLRRACFHLRERREQMNELSTQDALVGLARRAHRVAIGAWVLASLCPGVAAAIAQYSSLADIDDTSALNTAALLIFLVGLGLALLGWVYWAVLHARLRREEYRAAPIPGCSALIALVLWLTFLVGGGILAEEGGNSNSLALPALLALGLGIAGMFGGFLGLIAIGVRIFSRDTNAHRARRARLLQTAWRTGREVREPSGWQLAPGLLGVIAGALLLLGSSLFVVRMAPLARPFGLPPVLGLVPVWLIGALCFFFSLRALILVAGGKHTLYPIPGVRSYAWRAALVATLALLLMAILDSVGLAFLSIIPLIVLAFIAQRLRRHYHVPHS